MVVHLSHKSWQSLGDLLAHKADAFKLRKGRPWDTMKAAGLQGPYRSLEEVTHGALWMASPHP